MRINTLIAAAAASVSAAAATAGGFTAEVVEPVVVVPEPVATGSAGSMGGIAPLLIALGIIAVAVALRKKK